jgi:hypothetical protein
MNGVAPASLHKPCQRASHPSDGLSACQHGIFAILAYEPPARMSEFKTTIAQNKDNA